MKKQRNPLLGTLAVSLLACLAVLTACSCGDDGEGAAQNNTYDLAITNGRVIDPFTGMDQVATVAIANGVLASYLLDTYTGRKLGLASTGNASRSLGQRPTVGPMNFYVRPGALSAEEIIRSVDRGLYVTEMIGFGVNLVTGDYSRGAVGMWIEKGKLAYPVEEITIAGNLKDILRDIEMIGKDLEWRSSIASPTLKIARMTVAGN